MLKLKDYVKDTLLKLYKQERVEKDESTKNAIKSTIYVLEEVKSICEERGRY